MRYVQFTRVVETIGDMRLPMAADLCDTALVDEAVKEDYAGTSWGHQTYRIAHRRYENEHGKGAIEAYIKGRSERRGTGRASGPLLPASLLAHSTELRDDAAAYRAFVVDKLLSDTTELLDRIRLSMDARGIVVWRWMRVQPGWISTLTERTPLGVFWSFERKAYQPNPATQAHGGVSAVEMTLEACVRPQAVDWPLTLRLNLGLSSWHRQEKEVRLHHGASIEIRHFITKDESILKAPLNFGIA